jgi:acetolactate synthase I/II/III large subunit
MEEITVEPMAPECVERVVEAVEHKPQNGAACLIDCLVRHGVTTVFGYPGGAVLPLYDALHIDGRIRHVLVRHEQAALHAAEAYARVTRTVGVVLVTSGPGVANTISGLLNAMSDSIPLLCISGQVASGSIGTDAFQECDALGISRPVTKWCHPIRHVDEIPQLVSKALAVASSGRPGPVLLDFPKDVQASPCSDDRAPHGSAVARFNKRFAPRTAISLPQVQKAVDLISRAKRPVFYGGGGLISAGSEACETFARIVRAVDAPCTLTLMGLGAFPASDDHFLGMLGMHGTLEANLAMHEADLVVCVGARFDDRITGKLSSFCPYAKKIHIDIDAAQINKVVKVDVPIVGDCGQVLAALADMLWSAAPFQSGHLASWWARIDTWRKKDCLKFAPSPTEVMPQALMSEIATQLKGRDAIVSTDVGQHQMWAAQYLPFERPHRFLTSGGAGTMGFGLPAAIGAQVAAPDALCVCVSGDASVLMNIQEMSTAIQHRCPVKLIISNNGYMGMVRQWQELNHGGRYSHSYTEALPDFVALARAFGWDALRVEHPQDLQAGLARCLASDRPFLLDVKVASQTNCFPMIPAGRGHHEIMLSEKRWYSEEPVA